MMATVGCQGIIGESSGEDGKSPGGAGGNPSNPTDVYRPPPAGSPAADNLAALYEPSALGPQPLRRLTRSELRFTLFELLGIDLETAIAVLPADDHSPFDNDATTQTVSPALVSGLAALSETAAAAVIGDTDIRDRVVGCTPSGPADETCFRSFVTTIGRRALRRPLEPSEIDELATLLRFAEEENDFYVAVQLALEVILQDLELVYRIEIGTPVAGNDALVELVPHELATRLAFLAWGRGPDDALLDRAAAGELDTADQVWEAMVRLLGDERAIKQVQRVHAMWMGYEVAPLTPDVLDILRVESDALIERVVFEDDRPWIDLFTFPETFVNEELAAHYGVPAPPQPGFESYPDDGRRGGILSHGSWLSAGARFGDTSPTLRGKNVVERFLCWEIPPPPPGVNADEPPPGGADTCKPDRYTMSERSECKGCHGIMDPIGFGLENFGPAGQWRDHEVDRDDCVIDGQGDVRGVGSFARAAELGELLVGSGELEPCFVRNVYQQASGRPPEQRTDREMLEALVTVFEERGRLEDLVMALATSTGFRYRMMEVTP